jgi:hypothetical protein
VAFPQHEADADVPRVVFDVVRHHAVDAHDRQEERDDGEGTDEGGQRAWPLERLRHQVIDRRHSGQGDFRINRRRTCLIKGTVASGSAAVRTRRNRSRESSGIGQ